MEKIKDFCKKYLLNKKVMFGAYITVILIILVLVISSSYESKKSESMASEVKTVDPASQIAQIPGEVIKKEETRIETLQRIEKEEAEKKQKGLQDSLAEEEALNVAQAKRLEQSVRSSLAYGNARAVSHASNTSSSRRTSANRRPMDNPQDELTEFEKFKLEMEKLDSLQKAGPESDAKNHHDEKPVKSEDKTFFVYKEGFHGSPYFNSIIDTGEPSYIKAMIDEVVKAKQSSRVRLRLLDDITIDGKVIPRNHYLYAHVSGFSGQRIMLSITSMLFKDKIYAVNLEIYDLDGYSGLHVPRSSFQEFMQDFNSSAVSSTNIEVAETKSSRLAQMGYDMLDNLISASRKALQDKAKSNKAKVKYNTQVLLINANEK